MNDDTQVVPQAEPVATDTSVQGTPDSASVQVEEAPVAAPAQSSADANATDTAEKLFAGKYKTVEELEKSYKELNSSYSRETQEKAELSRILADAFAAEPVVPAVPQATDYEDYSQTPQASNQADDTVTKKLALMEFAMGHPDANGEAMVEILRKDPTVNQIPNYEAKLNYAYAVSRTQMQPKAIEAAQKQAQVDAQVKIAEKQAAQVESASRQSPAPDTNQSLSPQQIHDTMNNDDAFGELLKKQFPGISSMLG